MSRILLNVANNIVNQLGGFGKFVGTAMEVNYLEFLHVLDLPFTRMNETTLNSLFLLNSIRELRLIKLFKFLGRKFNKDRSIRNCYRSFFNYFRNIFNSIISIFFKYF